MDEEPDDLIELTRDNFPFKDIEPVLPFMREMQPYEIALAARKDGYTCSNTYEPAKSFDLMEFAIVEESEWRDLPLAAVRFWKMLYHKWRLWKFQNRRR